MEDRKIVKLLFSRAENAISELSTRSGMRFHLYHRILWLRMYIVPGETRLLSGYIETLRKREIPGMMFLWRN